MRNVIIRNDTVVTRRRRVAALNADTLRKLTESYEELKILVTSGESVKYSLYFYDNLEFDWLIVFT